MTVTDGEKRVLIERGFLAGAESAINRIREALELIQDDRTGLTISFQEVDRLLNMVSAAVPHGIKAGQIMRDLGYTAEQVEALSEDGFKAIMDAKGLTFDAV